ncbi:Dachshund 1 [Homalodisca vitripennis]|nr:Dachshund 1 [Homalodisca vitripennis]
MNRLREERGDTERALALDHKVRDLSLHNGSSNGHSPVLNLSKSGADQSGSEAGHTGLEDEDEDDNVSDVDEEDDKDQDLSDAAEAGVGGVSPHAINYSTLSASTPTQGPDPALSSTETLLRNIQGLLKVAADNARQQERQINYEKGRAERTRRRRPRWGSGQQPHTAIAISAPQRPRAQLRYQLIGIPNDPNTADLITAR